MLLLRQIFFFAMIRHAGRSLGRDKVFICGFSKVWLRVTVQMNSGRLATILLLLGLLLATCYQCHSQKVKCSSHVAKAFFMWCGMVKKRSIRSLDGFRTTRVVAVESQDSLHSSPSRSLSIGAALLQLLKNDDSQESSVNGQYIFVFN